MLKQIIAEKELKGHLQQELLKKKFAMEKKVIVKSYIDKGLKFVESILNKEVVKKQIFAN